MFDEKPEKLNEQNPSDPIDTLSALLERVQNRPLLQKIEKNTSVLPTLLRALTITKGAKAAHMYVTTRAGQPVKQASTAERVRDEHGRFAKALPSVPAITPKTKNVTTAAAASKPITAIQPEEAAPSARPRGKRTVSAVVPPVTVERTPRAPRPRITAERPAATVQAAAPTDAASRERASNGRFKSAGEREREKQREESQAKGLGGFLKKALGAVLSKGKEHGGDIEDAAGKAVGGPIYEAAKEMYGAAGELKEKLQDEKTLLGKSVKWFGGTKAGSWLGKKTGLTGRSAPPTEGAEERRHHELLEAVNGQHGGGGSGGGGVSDLVEGGIAGGLGYKLLKKIPGVERATTALTKLGPVLTTLATGATLAAVGVIATAAAGFAGVMNIINRGKANGVGYNPTPDQSRTIDPTQTKGPTEAQKKKWRDGMSQSLNPTIDAASKKNGLDPDLTKGVIGAESEFNPNAKSKAGAVGLMQLMPETATALGVGNPRDPAANIKGGTAHLGRLMRKYGGNETYALQAYNWGEGNMDAYLKTGKGAKGQPMPRETAEYPSRVQRGKEAFGKPNEVKALDANSPTISIAPARQELRDTAQPVPLQDIVPAPVTATLMGADKLAAAIKQQQNAPKRESAQPSPIRTHYDDTIVNLMAHDRI